MSQLNTKSSSGDHQGGDPIGYNGNQLLEVNILRGSKELSNGPTRDLANEIVHAYDEPDTKYYKADNPFKTVAPGVEDPRVDDAILQIKASLKK